VNKIKIGQILQLAGAGGVIVALILSLHHWPIAVAGVLGGAAFYAGKKLRGA